MKKLIVNLPPEVVASELFAVGATHAKHLYRVEHAAKSDDLTKYLVQDLSPWKRSDYWIFKTRLLASTVASSLFLGMVLRMSLEGQLLAGS